MAGTDERRHHPILAAAQADHPAGQSACRLVLNAISPGPAQTELFAD